MNRDKSRRISETAQGWLEIEISGEHGERLLNLALQQGLDLHHIRRTGERQIRARLPLADVYELKPLLIASRCRFRVLKRGGYPFMLRWCRRRVGLVLGGALFALALYLVCSFIWQVQVESVYPLSAAEREQVLNLAAAAGLKTGVLAQRCDFDAVRRQMLARGADLVFVNVERRGVLAVIQVARRQDVPREEIPLPPGDIVAAYGGLIENILVKSGQAAVKPGDTVQAGQVLVYGLAGESQVAASAIIEARMWSEAEAEWPLTERGFRPSGYNHRALRLCFGHEADAPAVWLWGGSTPPYEHFTHSEQAFIPILWRNIVLPVELKLNTWYEQRPYATSYNREEALYHACRRAEGLAKEALPGRCDILSQTTTELESGPELVRVRVIYEARCDIGQFVAY